MKKLFQSRSLVISIAAIAAGFLIGLGVGQIQIKNLKTVFEEKIREANKKTAYFQQKMAESKDEAMFSLEQQEQKCRSELEKLQFTLQKERKTLGTEAETLRSQVQTLEGKAKETDAVLARTKQELQTLDHNNKDLDRELKKTTSERNTLQAELKKTTRDVNQCSSNNAELCSIAQELVAKYKNKGIGEAILEKEPLTQVKKVELEKLVQDYRDEIERLKMNKNSAEGSHADE